MAEKVESEETAGTVPVARDLLLCRGLLKNVHILHFIRCEPAERTARKNHLASIERNRELIRLFYENALPILEEDVKPLKRVRQSQ
jgi:hypothetical protein